jgi:hypothetical protein
LVATPAQDKGVLTVIVPKQPSPKKPEPKRIAVHPAPPQHAAAPSSAV